MTRAWGQGGAEVWCGRAEDTKNVERSQVRRYLTTTTHKQQRSKDSNGTATNKQANKKKKNKKGEAENNSVLKRERTRNAGVKRL
jgi:Zn-finger nucleic acid-binding protein